MLGGNRIKLLGKKIKWGRREGKREEEVRLKINILEFIKKIKETLMKLRNKIYICVN